MEFSNYQMLNNDDYVILKVLGYVGDLAMDHVYIGSSETYLSCRYQTEVIKVVTEPKNCKCKTSDVLSKVTNAEGGSIDGECDRGNVKSVTLN